MPIQRDFPSSSTGIMDKLICRRRFQFLLCQVEELIFQDYDPGINMLCWAFLPFEKTITKDGLQNPMTWKKFPNDHPNYEHFARQEVHDVFVEHHKLAKKGEQHADILVLRFLDRALDVYPEPKRPQLIRMVPDFNAIRTEAEEEALPIPTYKE